LISELTEKPDEQIVALCEDLLAMAKRGDLRQVAYAGTMRDGAVVHARRYVSRVSGGFYHLLGAIRQLEWAMMSGKDE